MRTPVSFEFYPPKTDEQRAQLDRTADKLKTHAPDYVSCTFGACAFRRLAVRSSWARCSSVLGG